MNNAGSQLAKKYRWDKATPEQKKAQGEMLKKAHKKWWTSLTEEQKAERKAKIKAIKELKRYPQIDVNRD